VDIFFRAVGGAVQPNITSLPEPFFLRAEFSRAETLASGPGTAKTNKA
jgi:hypothetical protein